MKEGRGERAWPRTMSASARASQRSSVAVKAASWSSCDASATSRERTVDERAPRSSATATLA